MIYARELIEDITPVEIIQSIEWTKATNFVINTEVIGGRHWRERADCINQSDVLEWLDNQSPTIVVATDGSLRDSTTAWAVAAWTSDAQRVFEWSTARDGRSSSFRAECEAYEDALVWLSQVTTVADRTYLLTDSLSLISKIQAGRIKENWVSLFRGIKGHFVSVYVPGHCGISFNSG